MIDIKPADVKNAQSALTPYIRNTPFPRSNCLSSKLAKEIYLKCETLQVTGSFKIRGAANCVLQNLARAKKTGVIAASAGNHAQGVAAICKYLGISTTIVMPTTTPHIKVHNTQAWGATVELFGDVYDEAFDHAMGLAQTTGFVFVHPYKDPHVIAGQATIALELLGEENFKNIEALVIPVGGGGLISGCSAVLRKLRPDLKIYGVSARKAPSTWKSFHENKAVEEEVSFTLAEGVAAKRADMEIVAYLKNKIQDFLAVGEQAIAHAISLLAEHGKLVVEGAGALPLAACLEGLIPEKKVALLLSGGNIDLTTLCDVLQRGLVEQNRLVRLVIRVFDRPGGLHALTGILAEMRANVLQVFHQRAVAHLPVGEAAVEVDLETRGTRHTEEIINTLTERGFRVHRVA